MPSGRIVASEPFSAEAIPFAQEVPPGHYDAILSVANINQDQRIAFAIIRLADGDPVYWEVATPHGEDSSIAHDYGVDGGFGSFMDLETAMLIRREFLADMDYIHRVYDHVLDGKIVRQWANIELDPESGANLVMFSSGWGDGNYTSYWGMDHSREKVVLVTDFEVVKGQKHTFTDHISAAEQIAEADAEGWAKIKLMDRTSAA